MLASVGMASQSKPERPPDLARMDLMLKQSHVAGPSIIPKPKQSSTAFTRATRTALNQRLTDEEFFADNPAGAAALDYDEGLDPIHAGILSSEEAQTLFDL